LHAIQSTDSTSVTSNTSEQPSDEISEAGVSNASSWISKALASGGLSFFTATCTVFGFTGFSVYLPLAFAQGGLLLTSIVLGAVVLQTYNSSSFVIEACARAQALDLLRTDGSSIFRQPRRNSMKIRDRKYELSRLTKIFLGKSGCLFFSVTTLASMYGIMWAFCSTFANSFADKSPLGDLQDGGYKLYIAIFMVVTVPLSCTSIVDQQCIHMACVTARLVMVILMIGTIAGAYGADEPHYQTVNSIL
jgi:hypothetical protein